MSCEISNCALVQVGYRLNIARTITVFCKISEHNLALVTCPHDKSLAGICVIVEDHRPEACFQVPISDDSFLLL